MVPVPQLNKQLAFIEVHHRLFWDVPHISDGGVVQQHGGLLLFCLRHVDLLVALLLHELMTPMFALATIAPFIACDIVILSTTVVAAYVTPATVATTIS
jgi:hypothetical protein